MQSILLHCFIIDGRPVYAYGISNFKAKKDDSGQFAILKLPSQYAKDQYKVTLFRLYYTLLSNECVDSKNRLNE